MPIHALQPSLIWAGLLVLAVVTILFAGAVIVQRARQDLIGEEESEDANGVADTLRTAYEAGDLSEEEYLKVRTSLGNQDDKGLPPKVPRF